jgi:excisionase family DNA binding protein
MGIAPMGTELLARDSAAAAERHRRASLAVPLLTAREAAALLAVRPSWVYEAVREGRLPCLRIGRHVRFTRELLEEWLAGQT